jgi:hypothetical protein
MGRYPYKLWLYLIMLFAFPTFANAQCIEGTRTLTSYIKAERLLSLPQPQLDWFVAGYVHGLLTSPLAGAPEECTTRIYECIRGRSSAQLGAIVRKHVQENPENWDNGAGGTLWQALLASCLKQ